MSNDIHTGMPVLARHEGEWKGEYIHVAPDNSLVDRHASHLICAFPESGEFPYVQKNIYTWSDGRREELDFPAHYRDSRLWWDNERIVGSAWEIDSRTIMQLVAQGFAGQLPLQDDPHQRRRRQAHPHLALVCGRRAHQAHLHQGGAGSLANPRLANRRRSSGVLRAAQAPVSTQSRNVPFWFPSGRRWIRPGGGGIPPSYFGGGGGGGSLEPSASSFGARVGRWLGRPVRPASRSCPAHPAERHSSKRPCMEWPAARSDRSAVSSECLCPQPAAACRHPCLVPDEGPQPVPAGGLGQQVEVLVREYRL